MLAETNRVQLLTLKIRREINVNVFCDCIASEMKVPPWLWLMDSVAHHLIFVDICALKIKQIFTVL